MYHTKVRMSLYKFIVMYKPNDGPAGLQHTACIILNLCTVHLLAECTGVLISP